MAEGFQGDESELATTDGVKRLRDNLITKARQGEISPERAEADAKAAGMPPLASEPPDSEYNPMAQSRWSLLQALAWIAWRDLSLVRDQNSEFRLRCTQWVCEEWDQPLEGEASFISRKAWFLEPWRPSTAFHLHCSDNSMRAAGTLPKTARLTPAQAERDLWRRLSEGQLVAEGKERSGVPVEIASLEWEYLERFEDLSGRQILKYHASDSNAAYSEVRFKRDAILSIWPRHEAVDLELLDLGTMLDLPLERITGTETYVPLESRRPDCPF